MTEITPSDAYQEHQRARATVEVGGAVRLTAEIDLTPRGLMAIGLLTSAILMSTSLLVATATRRIRGSRHDVPRRGEVKLVERG